MAILGMKSAGPLGARLRRGIAKHVTSNLHPHVSETAQISAEMFQSATGLRPHEPGQLLAQSLRFVYSVFPMTRAWLARRRAAPHGRAALRAAFGGRAFPRI